MPLAKPPRNGIRIYAMPYQIHDRGFDREFRFYCKVPGDTEVGVRIDTEHGPRLVYRVGRKFGEPPMRYAYVDVSAAEIGAVDVLTPQQAAFRRRTDAIRSQNDAAAAAAILAALERDGWSSARNTPCSDVARRRVYAELVEAGVLELDGYRYVPKRNA